LLDTTGKEFSVIITLKEVLSSRNQFPRAEIFWWRVWIIPAKVEMIG
jgi:hypothetical protein